MTGKEDEAGLRPGAPSEVDAPSFFNAGPRVRRDVAWAVGYAVIYTLTLVLGGVAASAVNPAFDVLTSTSALAVRSPALPSA